MVKIKFKRLPVHTAFSMAGKPYAGFVKYKGEALCTEPAGDFEKDCLYSFSANEWVEIAESTAAVLKRQREERKVYMAELMGLKGLLEKV